MCTGVAGFSGKQGRSLFVVGLVLVTIAGCREKNIATPTTAPKGTSIGLPDPASADATAVFPDLPHARMIVRGVKFYEMTITGSGPGLPMELLLYLPSGRHDPKSLPCVFIAPAGAAMWGMAFDQGDRLEHIPYAHSLRSRRFRGRRV